VTFDIPPIELTSFGDAEARLARAFYGNDVPAAALC
jgi:hypothetical protein